VRGDQAGFLEPDGDQDIGCCDNGEEQVRHGHYQGRPVIEQHLSFDTALDGIVV
jgi:hypothetical protein